ncbi:hypothetical protein LWI29_015238 [Acer saccharum]|uniref:RING-type E3 ubiquitin transferase n=1 Tax=Acer saccharum TaxID=4024 RepID=A0AA39V9E7_ACESA|nr:hypothetical protein LWI29_015238 [Acer saccharum]
MAVFKPLTKTPFWVFFLFFFFVFLVKPSFEENDSSTKTPPDTNISNIATTNNPSPSPPPPYEEQELDTSPFKPSVAVIIGVLTTMFSITFLLLLYAKHCKNGNLVIYSTNHAGGVPPPSSSAARKNSGIDRTVIEALPLFRFGSLSGQKDGLECAVCLTRFDPTEVLRLLPKCKHAFHVECVDTWLDSHSTCPLCRNRVNPEDILLIQQDVNIFPAESQQLSPQREDLDFDKESPVKNLTESDPAELDPGFRRVSGRHSSAGVTGTGNGEELSCLHDSTSSRRSLDSVRFTKSESVAVGCFDRPRKDGLLLTDGLMADRKKSFERRFEHRIIISGGFHQRWSDVQPSDPLYLRSEMIISDSHRISLGSSVNRKQQQRHSHSNVNEIGSSGTSGGGGGGGGGGGCSSGNSIINTRSVSEITGLSRFSSRESNGGINRNRNGQRQAGLVSRWLAWLSTQSQSQTAGRSDHNTHTSTFV